MKQALGFSPIFDPATKTVNFTAYSGFDIKKLYAIINVTANQTIYAVGMTTYGLASITGSVLTLTFDTTSMNSTDKLLVLYDSGLTVLPQDNTEYTPVRPVPQKKTRTSFAKTLSGVDPEFFSTIVTGPGQSVNQTGGNLVITAGTTARAETILRSVASFSDSFIAKLATILSQRIINQNFYFELVDVIGDNLAYTINSATSVTVVIPGNPFNSENVGQGMYLGNITGAAGIPARYVIASVSGENVTFTVAAWPASGSGTLSLFGWNYHQVLYSGTTATNSQYDAQRNGWNSGFSSVTSLTTASPGHLAIMQQDEGLAMYMDQLLASAAGIQTVYRASRVQSIPGMGVNLFLQIRVANGSTAPASNTTWTIALASLENFVAQAVTINSMKPTSPNSAIPVQVLAVPTTPVSGSLTSAGTVTSVGSVTSSNTAIPGIVTDIASGAITTTTTTAALTPTAGGFYTVMVPVTVATGTNPTLDIGVEESDDTGANWYRVYDFPRITAVGAYRSPVLRLRGNRVRYVQTVGGTTPSFTRAINRLQSSSVGPDLCQVIDRSIDLNTLDSVTPSYLIDGRPNLNVTARVTAQTTPATLTLELSADGSNWFLTTITMTTVVGIVMNKTSNEQWKFARLKVTTAGTGVTLGEAQIKAVSV